MNTPVSIPRCEAVHYYRKVDGRYVKINREEAIVGETILEVLVDLNNSVWPPSLREFVFSGHDDSNECRLIIEPITFT